VALDDALDKIVSGGWDLEAWTRIYARELEARPALKQFHSLMLDWKYDQAYPLGHELVAGPFSHNAIALYDIARRIADPGHLPRRQDLNLALEAAERANDLAGGRDEGILQILAIARSQREQASGVAGSQGNKLPGEGRRE